MPNVLRRLKVTDVSSVDVGAGRGVKVVLTKRDEERAFELGKRHAAGFRAPVEVSPMVQAVIDESVVRHLEKLGGRRLRAQRADRQTFGRAPGNKSPDTVVAGDKELLGRIADAKAKATILDIQRKENCGVKEAIAWATKHGIALPKAVTDMVVRVGDVPGKDAGPLSKFEAEIAKLGDNPPALPFLGTADPKRGEESTMSGSDMLKCPSCGCIAPEDDFEEIDGDVGKLQGVNKAAVQHGAVKKSFAGIVADVAKANPTLNRRECEKLARDTPEFMQLVKDERGFQHGAGYRF